MTQEKAILVEETLDPEDWEAARALGHQMLDDMLDYLKTVRDHPVWQPIPEEVKGKFQMPPPLEPQRPEEIYEEFSDFILPYPSVLLGMGGWKLNCLGNVGYRKII